MSNQQPQYLQRDHSELQHLKAQHTAKEITQQLQLWADLTEHLAKVQTQLDQFLTPLFQDSRLRVLLTGAGTSAFVGEAIVPALRSQNVLDIHSVASTDLVSNPTLYLHGDRPTLLVSFARSGNSPESVAAVNIVDQLVSESYHLFITCNKNGQLAVSASQSTKRFCLLMPEVTNDQSFAMTSSYSCMYLSALHCLDQQSHSQKSQQRQWLSEYCQQSLDTFVDHCVQLAAQDFQRLVFLGSGGLQGNARESSLKCMELTAGKLVSTHDSSLGFRHGPKFIVNEKTLVIVMRSNDPYTQQYDDDIIAELRRDAVAKVLVLSSEPLAQSIPQITEQTGNLSDVYQGLAWVMFAQVLGFQLSISLGLSPDNPCPSGEVNRVVQGVIIHPVTAHA
ncbi:MAG: SIS domain-containing protein [Pseudomonadales bacterium]|nr:SIS domain-containing protein [Pseudomonadales bacterium]